MKRVYIVGNFKYPRSGATSNYVQYLGCALVKAGYDVNVISLKNDEFDDNEYKNIKIYEIVKSEGKVLGYWDFYTGMANKIISVLKKEMACSDDCVMIYSVRPYAVKKITDYCHKNGIKVGNIVTEMFARDNFDSIFDYMNYKKMNNDYIPQGDFVLPISTWLRDYFDKFKVKQLVLPIMADVEEYENIEKKHGETIRFIFPGNGVVKDSLEEMVNAISHFLTNYDINAEFHFCGINEKNVEHLLPSGDIKNKIIFHDWLKYDQLIQLYMDMDFLLLARSDCQMCRANFPSKVPELMSYGVVPVASIVGDYTKYYLKDNVNSILFYGCEKESIEKAIVRACKLDGDGRRRLSKEALKMVKTKLDYRNWDVVLRDFLESKN
jgi:glycosyltransferase involved in cell wall biosynthesis